MKYFMDFLLSIDIPTAIVASVVGWFGPWFWSFFRNRKKFNRIESLIEYEITENYKNLRRNEENDLFENVGMDSRHKYGSVSMIIDLNIWKKYRFQLAEYRPETYKRYKEINQYLQEINKIPNDFNRLSEVEFESYTRLTQHLVKSFLSTCDKEGYSSQNI
jgi:hypothetical protein